MNHEKIGLTIMDGPFCSVMPKGNNKNEFLLYHPKYSVVSESSKNNLGEIDVDKAGDEETDWVPCRPGNNATDLLKPGKYIE